jgi:uncharacterized protein (DUF488 family)
MTKPKTATTNVMKCLNIGYQGKSMDSFCDILVSNRVRLLIDVRANAWSQRPEFRKTALQNRLSKHGILYFHFKMAGNPYKPKKGEQLDFNECATKYLEHLHQNPVIIQTLESILTKQDNCALLCFESDVNQCHRGLLVNALQSRNKEFEAINL